MLKYLLNITVFIFTYTAAVSSAENHQLKVGVITPLTGKMSTIGTAVKNGIELARAENPEAFSNISFIYEDDQFDGKQSILAFNKLRDADHVSIVFGFGDTLGIVLGPLAERSKIPLINFNFEANAAVGKSFVIRSLNHTQQYMSALANYMQRQGNFRFYLVRAESPFFNAMADSFKDSVRDPDLVEDLGRVNPNDTDFRLILLSLITKESRPIGLFLAPDQLIAFARQARELSVHVSLFGTDLFETAARITGEKDLFKNALYADNTASDWFRARYKAEFGNLSQLTFAGSGYDMANLVAKFNSLSTFINDIESIRYADGVLGKYSFVNDSKTGKFFEYPIRIKQISGAFGVSVN